MIRSTKTSTKFSNTNKLNNISLFIQEYKTVCQYFIDNIWNLDKIPSLLPKELTENVNMWLSKRAIQAAAKQASGIVRGTKQKQKQRLFIYNKLVKDNYLKKARKLKKIIDKTINSKPVIKNISPELDSRFVKIDINNSTSFDGWITLTSLGNKLKIIIPFKKNKHFNEMMLKGKLKKGIRLHSNSITFMFEIEDKQKDSGETIGLDIGIKSVYTTSNNQLSSPDKDG
jgi:hypothetical protein